MVHRPKYDDWSFPKGKSEPDEPLPVCAVREVAEETGAAVRLGRQLPGVCYRDADGKAKRVSYWAATVVRMTPRTASPREIDRTEWVPIEQAADRLTAPSDASPLDALTGLDGIGGLATVPLIVIRHATARPRDSWTRADADRPLVAAGRRQAAALAPLLDCWSPETIVSSPWRRCLETLAPYVDASGIKVRTKGGLSERGFRRNPGKAVKHLRNLVERGRPGVLCTHRPVLAGVMSALDALTVSEMRPLLPLEDPHLAPCEILVAHVRRAGSGPPVLAIERHRVSG